MTGNNRRCFLPPWARSWRWNCSRWFNTVGLKLRCLAYSRRTSAVNAAALSDDINDSSERVTGHPKATAPLAQGCLLWWPETIVAASCHPEAGADGGTARVGSTLSGWSFVVWRTPAGLKSQASRVPGHPKATAPLAQGCLPGLPEAIDGASCHPEQGPDGGTARVSSALSGWSCVLRAVHR